MNEETHPSLHLILAAAGSSSRMGIGTKKEYLSLHGGTVLSEAVALFLNTAHFESVTVTIPKGDDDKARAAFFADKSLAPLLTATDVFFIPGGDTRQQSVFLALQKIKSVYTAEKDSIVLIHDAARPFVTKQIISDVIDAARKYGAAVPGVTPVDTQKQISSEHTIIRHLVRSELCAVQTPQAFLFDPLLVCHQHASHAKKQYTDDTEIWDTFINCTDAHDKKVHVVDGDVRNKKITFASDIPHEEFDMNEYIFHTGIGTDLHQLVAGRKLLLGGVTIPFDKGELGHSDGDVLLHAITDALLGASGLGDIGSYFPPEDMKWKDADSSELLKKVWNDVTGKGWSLCNLDCVVEIEKPKFLPYRAQVISSIARILNVSTDAVFVKAKTNEQLEAVGRGEAVKSYCVCLLKKAAVPPRQ